VKELKEDFAQHDLGLLTHLWNPVKELKVFRFSSKKTWRSWSVESGEGIERKTGVDKSVKTLMSGIRRRN